MYCRSCGAENDDNAYRCVKCEQVLHWVAAPLPPGQQIDDYLVWSILSAALCCMVPGIVGVVYSTQVRSKLAVGDYEGARQSAKTAKTWTWAAFGIGLVAQIGWLGLMLASTFLDHH